MGYKGQDPAGYGGMWGRMDQGTGEDMGQDTGGCGGRGAWGDTGQGAVGYETAFGEQRMWPVLALLGMALAGLAVPQVPPGALVTVAVPSGGR